MLNLDDYTAWRLECSPQSLRNPGTHVAAATPDRDPWLPEPLAAKRPDVICIVRRGDVAIVRTHQSPTDLVRRLLERLPRERAFRFEEVSELADAPVRPYLPEPWLYLDRSRFQPVDASSVRLLTERDGEAMASLHASVDARMRWYVEIDHPVVFGLFHDGRLVAAASHFLFPDFRIAAAGVLTHPAYRKRGFGTSVTSEAVAWALERDFTVEWSTNEENLGSLGISRRLGFEPYAVEREFRIGDAGPTS